MSTNPSSATVLHLLDITCRCSPDPVTATGAKHEVELSNTSSDRYTSIHMAVSIWMPVQGCGLTLRYGQTASTLLPKIPLGPLPGGTTGKWTVDVERVPGGATRFETIKTVVEFVNDRELDPLDDDPASLPISISPVVKIDVAVA